ncbi:unnamed protein product [Ranitomeya imitator]|uniref:Uncharacterized protein n=1 Tax=Ranitomeya imitator TaxID=111125 RepID=A0ABN9LPE3_9NEOB|nr:unnamed protein product [Ranitomeya imitator]
MVVQELARKALQFDKTKVAVITAPSVSFRRLPALTDQAEGAAHTICVIAPSDLNSQSADAGKMERRLERGQDIVPVYQIKGISKLFKLCLPKVQCFCDSLTSPPSERQFNALLMSVASLLANPISAGLALPAFGQMKHSKGVREQPHLSAPADISYAQRGRVKPTLIGRRDLMPCEPQESEDCRAIAIPEDCGISLEKAKGVSAGPSDDSLASDSGVFEALCKRNDNVQDSGCKQSEKREEPQVQVGVVHIRVYLPSLDSITPSSYCSQALDFQMPLTFNEMFHIPMQPSVLKLSSLQLYICSVCPEQQEELLGIAQISLAGYEGTKELQIYWYPVQIYSSAVPQRVSDGARIGDCTQMSEIAIPLKTDAVSVLLARTTAQLEAVERELEEELVKLEYTEEEIIEMEQKEDQVEATSERSWQADSVDSGCHSNSTPLSPHYSGTICGDAIHGPMCTGQVTLYDSVKNDSEPLKVDKETNTEDVFPEDVTILKKERSCRRSRGSPFVRSSTIVRSQTFSPGARNQYVCRLYRSDSDSSTLPRKSPFIRNTLERRTLRYKQQACQSSMAEIMARTSLDLELDLQASRTKQRQLNEEINALKELQQRLEEVQHRGQSELPQWVLRDDRFRSLLLEAERQTRQTKFEQHQEQAAEKMLKKASKEVFQLRGRNQKEPLQVQTFRPAAQSLLLTVVIEMCLPLELYVALTWSLI